MFNTIAAWVLEPPSGDEVLLPFHQALDLD